MDNQDYSIPLVVSRACFDEVLRRLAADGRAVGDGNAIDMRGVLLVVEDVPGVVVVTEAVTRHLVQVAPAPESVTSAPHGSTFTVEHGDWRYEGVRATLVNGAMAVEFDLSSARRSERLSSPNTRSR